MRGKWASYDLPVSSERHPVLIVGAGLAGLACARALERAAVPCLLLEASDAVGGRVRSDVLDGFTLDRGFQVHNTAYREAQAVLDHAALDLRPFEPGALTFAAGDGLQPAIDPFRRPAALPRLLRSKAATTGDALRVWRLRREVLSKSPEQLLTTGPDIAAIDFLHARGFGSTVIETFFRPFFGGVFLDRSLGTSARLFRWLFRCFAEGQACVPAGGIEQIPRQLAAGLRCEVRLNTPVASVAATGVTLAGGGTIEGSAVVVACDPPTAARLLDLPSPPTRTTATAYFDADRPLSPANLLLLAGDRHDPADGVNTAADLSAAAPSYAPPGRTLLSVSMIGDELPDDEAALTTMATAGLRRLFGVSPRHLRTYRVDHALPWQPPPFALPHAAARADGVVVCGDWQDTASINGALRSGRLAAEAVIAGR